MHLESVRCQRTSRDIHAEKGQSRCSDVLTPRNTCNQVVSVPHAAALKSQLSIASARETIPYQKVASVYTG